MSRTIANAAAWMVGFRITERAIGLVSTVVLARLLVPSDFGLVAMAMTVVAFIELVGAFGFDSALIRAPALGRPQLDTAWSLNAMLGLFMTVAIAILATPAAQLYDEPRLQQLLWVLSISALIQGLQNPAIIEFRREMTFRREFNFLLAQKAVGFCVTLLLAATLRSYWALIAGTLASRTFGLLLSYRMRPYRPRFSLEARSELLGFSGWLLANNMLGFLGNRYSQVVIGRFAGASGLGVYSIASEIATLPSSELLAPINRALFPGLSRLAGVPNEFRTALLGAISVAVMLVVPAAFGLAAVAEPLVLALLGQQWVAAVPVIRLLAFAGAATAVISAAYPAYLALNRPKMATYLIGGKTLLTLPFITYAAATAGLVGVAKVELLSSLLYVPVSLAVVMRITRMGWPKLLGSIWRPLIAGSCMFVVVDAFVNSRDAHTQSGAALLTLLGACALGAGSYVSLMSVMWWGSGRRDGAETLLWKYLSTSLRFRGPIER